MNYLLAVFIFGAVILAYIVFKRKMQYWIFSYLRGCLFNRRSLSKNRPVDVIFCFVDHFEPKRGKPGLPIEKKRMDFWAHQYPAVAVRHKDCDGFMPQHTFFYPAEEYEESYIDTLAGMCRQGLGEVEIHLHHENDTAENLKLTIEGFKSKLADKGLLSKEKVSGALKYGFIHGSWALGNSLNGGRYCGVNNELSALKDTGCYADFTLPAVFSEAQTRKINSIYYAQDTGKPKPHDTGEDVSSGKPASGGLMIIQGPLAFDLRRRKFGIFPKVEYGEISVTHAPDPDRVDLWIRQRIAVKNRPEWIFVKVYTHGVRDDNLDERYFTNLDRMFSYLEANYNDGKSYRLHYVSAREMYNIIKAAEAGKEGNPGQFRDYILDKSAARRAA